VKVFVAGASGALGPPAVRALVAAGHDVTAMTRTPAKRRSVEELGAMPVLADALDAGAVRDRVAEAKPEVVVDLLTALPKAGPRRPSDLEATNEVRRVGSRNLTGAAKAAGARRYVAESFFLVYGYGDHGPQPLDEDAPPPPRRAVSTVYQRPIDALAAKERTALGAGLEGVVLRFGGFYGRSAGTQELIRLLKRRRLPVVRSDSVTPWVHLEDAATAVVAAVERGRPGAVYNVVDDEPVSLAKVLTALAEQTGAPPPFTVPRFVLRLAVPYLVKLFVDSSFRLSNSRAKQELGWSPRYPTIREGLGTLVEPRP
jgi:nucleoside-diphosphate-sugar epimerase